MLAPLAPRALAKSSSETSRLAPPPFVRIKTSPSRKAPSFESSEKTMLPKLPGREPGRRVNASMSPGTKPQVAWKCPPAKKGVTGMPGSIVTRSPSATEKGRPTAAGTSSVVEATTRVDWAAVATGKEKRRTMEPAPRAHEARCAALRKRCKWFIGVCTSGAEDRSAPGAVAEHEEIPATSPYDSPACEGSPRRNPAPAESSLDAPFPPCPYPYPCPCPHPCPHPCPSSGSSSLVLARRESWRRTERRGLARARARKERRGLQQSWRSRWCSRSRPAAPAPGRWKTRRAASRARSEERRVGKE